MPRQFVLNGLGTCDVRVSDVAVKSLRILLEKAVGQLEFHVATGPDAPVVGKARFLGQPGADFQGHLDFSLDIEISKH
jgi:hypothetical protein